MTRWQARRVIRWTHRLAGRILRRMRVVCSVLVPLVALATLSGCTSSSPKYFSSAGKLSPVQTSQSPSYSSPVHLSTLTGYGASRRVWDAHHEANPASKLYAGCCYGPPVAVADDGGTTVTWDLTGDGTEPADRIKSVAHYFPPHTNSDEVIANVASNDLPADALQQDEQSSSRCRVVYFTSRTLGVTPGIGDGITVVMFSPVNPFSDDNVEMALIRPGDSAAITC